MGEHTGWQQLRDKRMDEPGAEEAYETARLAFEAGEAAGELRAQRR